MMAVFVGGTLDGKVMDVYEVLRDHCNGKLTEALTAIRNAGGCVHRHELDNQPMVDGYLSPMWDNGVLRYETQEVYDMMFD